MDTCFVRETFIHFFMQVEHPFRLSHLKNCLLEHAETVPTHKKWANDQIFHNGAQ
jgi:hypothetical protein